MARGRKIIRQVELEEITIRAAAEEFYKHNKAKGLAVETQRGYVYYVNAFIQWIGEDTVLSDVKVKDIDKYMYMKMDEVKPVTVATIMVHLRRFFKFAYTRDYMDEVQITIPKYEKEPKEPYTDAEMYLLLKKPDGRNWVEYRNWVMINYFYGTGQRLSTVLNIKVAHVDLAGGKVWLEWNKDKIKKWMPLSSALVKILREYINASDLQEQDYLFPEYEGKQLKNRSAEDAIADYNRTRGVSKTSIHLFRHKFARDYIVNGGNPVKLQKLLNHKTMEMTMNYVRLYGEDMASDLDLYNPLDNFKRKNYKPVKREKVYLENGKIL